jgi:hypothetical protein
MTVQVLRMCSGVECYIANDISRDQNIRPFSEGSSPDVRLAPSSNGTGAPSPKVKWAGRKADNLSTSSAEVRNENGLSYSFVHYNQ